jgi:hypothetical protein
MTIKPIKFVKIPADCKVEWSPGLPLPAERKSADFYKGYGSLVCTVKKLGFSVDVYLDGDMSYYNPKENLYCDDGDDLIARGYDTDEKLAKALETEELRHDMNPWFDMYVEGEHLDAVTDDIEEALSSADSWLTEEMLNAAAIEVLVGHAQHAEG